MNENIKRNLIAFLVAASLIWAGLILLGCEAAPMPVVETVPARRHISPRCVETAQEVPQMRTWCNSTMIAPSRARESCRFVADYERNCQ